MEPGSKSSSDLKYKFQSILILISFLITFSTCSTSKKISVFQRPTKLSIGNLTALNLSEDMNEASTQEDEILLIIYTLQNQTGAPRFKERSSREYTFKKRQEKINIALEIPTTDPFITGILFCLVELDNEESQEKAMSILDQYLHITSLDQFDDLAIDRALGHDDFLDWYYVDFKKAIPKKITFKGLQMFDRFDYHLEINQN